MLSIDVVSCIFTPTQEEGTRLLGMIHQGRPLSALPVGDLAIPSIPNLTVAPLLSRFLVSEEHQRSLKVYVGKFTFLFQSFLL